MTINDMKDRNATRAFVSPRLTPSLFCDCPDCESGYVLTAGPEGRGLLFCPACGRTEDDIVRADFLHLGEGGGFNGGCGFGYALGTMTLEEMAHTDLLGTVARLYGFYFPDRRGRSFRVSDGDTEFLFLACDLDDGPGYEVFEYRMNAVCGDD